MKTLLSILVSFVLVGCGQRPVQQGIADFIHYRTGPTTSCLLRGEDYKGQLAPAETIRYRNPRVILYNEYIVISDPGTDQKDKVIPRESLIELQWKK